MVERIDVLRVLGENLFVELFGLEQSSGVVMLEREIEGLLDRELSHAAATISDGERAISSDVTAHRGKGGDKVIVGLGELRPQGDCVGISGDCGVEVALLLQGDAEIAMRFGDMGSDRDCFAD